MEATALAGISHLSHIPFAYFVLNLDPILVSFGPFSVHWYGVAYVVAIAIGLFVINHWTRREGIHDDQMWSLFIWAAIGGLIGGRLYFVLQQPDLVQNYLLKPINIIAVWNGGMAFFGAIFAGSAMLFLLAPRYGLDRWLALDGGALFAAIGQPIARFGNIVNGDILGGAVGGPVNLPHGVCSSAPCFTYVADPHILPWALVYLNPNNTFVHLGVPFQPAPIYEILFNLVALALLWPLRYRLPKIRAGLFFTMYLMLYAISQFIVFFLRATEPTTPFLGISGLKQAQWTAIIVFLLCIPLALLILKVSKPWPFSQERPVPWPHFAPVDQQSPVPDTSSNALVAPPARRRSAPAVSSDAPSLADLPPWQPTRATGGRLRNLFGDMARTSSSQ